MDYQQKIHENLCTPTCNCAKNTQDGAMGPTIQMKYVPAFYHVSSPRNSLMRVLFKSPVFSNTLYIKVGANQLSCQT